MKYLLYGIGIVAMYVFVFVVAGCVNIGYYSSGGEKIKYSRFLGKQEISGFELEKDKDTLKVKFNKQSGDSTDVTSAMRDAATTLKNISEKIP